MGLIISEYAKEFMLYHATETYSDECCGFFYGKDGSDRIIHRALAVENVKEGDKRRRFQISPFDYMQAEKYALENDLTLLGIYHSHPDHPAIPSEHDLKHAVPYFSYIIVSVRSGQVADMTSWRLNGAGSFEHEQIINTQISA